MNVACHGDSKASLGTQISEEVGYKTSLTVHEHGYKSIHTSPQFSDCKNRGSDICSSQHYNLSHPLYKS